ncbi:amidohydrolase family protein [Bowmanella dokdonensis]|uniref:Amidohydrolase family protein n=1 Tax=Bowmanella dokdonensis TaxID=751969 RepID=A0A939DLS6_9ALTE|nr:amidohydrolase family protein [Bowmanella dokdonensis]MBN7824622.1 amidohydrolase family protein [Bowmanella dokdonensis]
MNKTAIAVLTGLLALSAQAENLAVVGGYVHTLSEQGSLENATVLIKEGRIQSVGQNLPVPSGYRVIDASGKIVTPGLIGAYTSLGLVEVGSSAGTVDASYKPRDYSPAGAALDVSYAINPDSTLLPVSRIEGFTLAATGMANTQTLFKGRGAVISLGDGDKLIKPGAFMTVSVDNHGADDMGGSRAALWPELENAVQEARSRKGKPLSAAEEWHGSLSKADVNALLAVVSGDMPLIMDARRLADIRQVLAFKARYPDIRVVLLKATEGWRIAAEIAEAGIPVILDPEPNLPYSFDQLGATLANAGRLSEAGVAVSIGVETHNLRLATQHAGNAVANGLPWQDGLAALTINNARLFGIDKEYGSLEAGKVADLVVWSGDPLEVMVAPEHVVIQGEEIVLESRQTKLRDRYLELDQDKPMSYVRP